MRESPSAESEGIAIERIGHVALVTLVRPEKANSITTEMAHQLHDACADLDRDSEVRVVVLTGTGKYFSAGSDISTLDEYPSAWAFRHRVDYCDAILGLRKPSIAMVSGAAFGGGLELALSCDIRVASTTARFAAPEVTLGWLGGGGASQLLPRLIGYGNALALLLAGTAIDASEAFRVGLVQLLVEPPELKARTMELAERIAANAPIATQAVKRAVRHSLSSSVVDGMDYEEELVAVCMATADRDEGIAAWREKRTPRFRGL